MRLSETTDPDKRQMLERTLQAVRLAVEPLERGLQVGLASEDVDSHAQVSRGPGQALAPQGLPLGSDPASQLRLTPEPVLLPHFLE